MQNKILIPVSAIVIAGATLFVVQPTYAQNQTAPVRMNFFEGFIQFFAQKFGLDKTQVETAVSQFQQEKRATITPQPTISQEERQAREKERLDTLVQEGKITQNQETAILNKLAEMHAKYNFDTVKDLSMEERKTKMEAKRTELIDWAKSQGIDSSYIMGGFGMGGHFGMGMKGKGLGNFGNWKEK